MKELIDEMSYDLAECHVDYLDDAKLYTDYDTMAQKMVSRGYRKQSEGEWIVTYNFDMWYYDCPFCDGGYAQEAKLPASNYCENCGAKLHEPKAKGGE